ncbi:hypothetical protein P691DRAFT_811633 [Macrolepiota fuliginosa MF-IS2]|uniref:Uncharacterized protein n=1 Tax=Macrolepiota fuliginosa MF-IS2 TaxID=1400762 RepID=A0A9P5XEC4_9AGAR|nr:hypothetical protein P691DRAFT_811633 [Macrolepiota fuliginosa MF-IS2]
MQAAPRHKLQKPTRNTESPTINGSNHIPFTNLTPQTPSEHYWASRTLKAEALLSAREKHYEEIVRVREEEELKRSRELQVLESRYKEKYDNLEKLVVFMAVAILLLIVLLIYSMTSRPYQSVGLFSTASGIINTFLRQPFGASSRSNYRDSDRNPASWLNLHFHLPSHFTIPILSPWTSVIEHQTSNTTNSSSSFSKTFIFISFLVAITISAIIFLNVHHTRHTPPIDKRTHQGPLERTNDMRRLLGVFLSPGSFSSLALWRWAWTWGCRTLQLLGLTSR